MSFTERARFALRAVLAHRLRTALTALGIAVGVAAVVLLTSIGEGVHRFVLAEFTQFGTHIVAVNPGKTTTLGMPGAILGTVRPLTLDDAEALKRVPYAVGSVPGVQGNAEIEGGGRQRRTTVLGTGPELPEVFNFRVAIGSFLPREPDPEAARPLAVLGATLRAELFGESNPLGRRIRVGGDRYRVIGVLEPKGDFLGYDLDDAIYVPASRALDLFDRESLMEVDVLYSAGAPVSEVTAGIRRILTARHGREDFTITTQEKMLDVLGSILQILTFAVGALGGISLAVGGVGILTIMTITVAERRGEIGLLRALGMERRVVLRLFLLEAAAVAAIGGLLGLLAAGGLVAALGIALPGLPLQLAWPFVAAAETLAVIVGLAAGILPARHAASLDAVEALRAE